MQQKRKGLFVLGIFVNWSASSAGPALTTEYTADISEREIETISVVGRQRGAAENSVPVTMTVLDGEQLEAKGIFNVSRLAEFTPSLQLYSSNPRNTAINIRGQGSPFGLTNDGIEQGVGMYVDGVYFAHPALATLDFINIDLVEVLRGPQGTLFGKNTTAGAINIRTRKPEFVSSAQGEISLGNYGYRQFKGSMTGPVGHPDLAARFSFSSTQRDGMLQHVVTGEDINQLDNLTLRSQLLFERDSWEARLIADYSLQRPRGYAQVFVRQAPTLRSEARQLDVILADLNYSLPSLNPFDRLTDTDTSHRANQDVGGISLTLNKALSTGHLSSVTAWRYWDWDPSNDRDFLGLPVTTVSANPSRQAQWSQEINFQGELTSALDIISGIFLFRQTIDASGLQQQGQAASRFLLDPAIAGATNPALLDGLTQESSVDSVFSSIAGYAQLTWQVRPGIRLIPGIRVNYDRKSVDFERVVSGGLQTEDPVLLALQRNVLRPQRYHADESDADISSSLTLDWHLAENLHWYLTRASAFKSLGINLSGLPADSEGNPSLEAVTVAPEDVRHWETGIKYAGPNVTFNMAAFDTTINQYQANVVNTQLGVLRGYLANADKVVISGAEADIRAQITTGLSLLGALSYTDARYERFTDAPVPIELTGSVSVFDASGTQLPGVSKWAASVSLEQQWQGRWLNTSGQWYISTDLQYRSKFSSSPTVSAYMMVDGYSLVNLQAGFRSDNGWDVYGWSNNVADTEYFEFLSAAPGGSGLIVGLPGVPRTFGITWRYQW